MKKLLSFVLATLMLSTSAIPVFAEDSPAGLTLAEDSHLVLDAETGYVDKIDGTITVGDLKANFANEITVAGKSDEDFVATDDAIGEYKALIYGDVNRDGKVNLSDVSGMLQSIAGWSVNVNTDAADVNKTGDVNLTDVTKLLKKIAGWADISLGNVRMIFENKALTAENEDSTLKLSFTSIMNKLSSTDVQHTGEHSYKINTARNEYESCTVYLYSDVAREGMTIELSDFVSEYGDAVLDAKIEWVQYLDCVVFREINPSNFSMSAVNEESNQNGGKFPEVVLELADSFEIPACEAVQFIITTNAGKDTPAGMYKATLTVKDSEGKEVKKADVYSKVYDFTLPDTPYSASLFNGNQTVEDYEFMLNYNVNDYCLPYEITDDRADAYMDDPRVTAFVIAGGGQWYGLNMYAGIMNKSDDQTIANYNKVASNPDWFKKGLFYYTDEPCDGGLYFVKQCYERVTELLGTTNIRNMTPLASNTYADDDAQVKNIDAVAFIDPYINVWCPQSNAYHLQAEKGKWTSRYAYNKYGEYADRVNQFKANGEEEWWYVCCSPEIPFANYFTVYQGVITRLLSWQQYFNDVDGVLYYRTFGGTITKYKFDISGGDGVLQYEAYHWGRDGYAPSWRLLQIRDGFDDFDYLHIAEELCGRKAVMDVVTNVSSGMLKYTEDYRVLEAARNEIMEMIVDSQAK